MRIAISDKLKKDLFVALFQTLKSCTNLVSVIFEEERMHIQGMDKSHVCMFEVNIEKGWFNEYVVEEETTVSFDTNIFHLIISTKQDSNVIIITYYASVDSDNLSVELTSQEHCKGEFNKFFKIPLADYDYELLAIPSVDYDSEFSINSKKICEIFSQMLIFGNDINIKCSEEKIDLITNGITGEMRVNIPIDDLTEYSIVEGEEFDLKYSLTYISKMCVTNRLTGEIDFGISADFPMRISYNLGDSSSIIFYIAPKIDN